MAHVEPTEHVNMRTAATLLGCTRHRVLNLVANGQLRPVPVAGRVFLLRAEVEVLAERLAAKRKPARAPRRRAVRR